MRDRIEVFGSINTKVTVDAGDVMRAELNKYISSGGRVVDNGGGSFSVVIENRLGTEEVDKDVSEVEANYLMSLQQTIKLRGLL